MPPIKCSWSILEDICELRSQGKPINRIADNVGVDRRTIHRWIKKGESARAGKYAKFYSDWEEATSKYNKIHPNKGTYKKNFNQARGNIPGYGKFIKNVLERDRVCVCCGYDDDLNVHHLYGVKERPEFATDEDKAVVLCKFCHLKYHQIYSRYNINPQDFEEFMDRFQVVREF